jgi:signal transduction histidine kinase
MRLPIRARLTLVSGGLTALVVVALGFFVYLRFEADLTEAVDEGLQARADAMLADADGTPTIGAGNPFEPAEAPAQLIDANGNVALATAGFEDPYGPPAGLAPIEGAFHYDGVLSTQAGSIPIRLVAVEGPDASLLVVGASLEDTSDALGRLAGLLLVGGPVAIGLAGVVGWLVAGAALKPVEQLRTEAEAISASEAGRRLVVPPTGDELARLATSLNRMLALLEAAVQRERRIVRDASHELRTPLANLKAELDLALRRARRPEELTAALQSASEEADRLVRLSEDLLVLARAEDGQLPVRREPTDLGQLISETVAGFGGRAVQLGVDLRVAAPDEVTARVDPLRLRQAVGNLVDNALKATPGGGRVTVSLTADLARTSITVIDTGPGFPPEFVDHALEPFSRGNAARSRTDGGAGLGLAIVSAVAEAHGGRVWAANRTGGGAEVTIELPLMTDE